MSLSPNNDSSFVLVGSNNGASLMSFCPDNGASLVTFIPNKILHSSFSCYYYCFCYIGSYLENVCIYSDPLMWLLVVELLFICFQKHQLFQSIYCLALDQVCDLYYSKAI